MSKDIRFKKGANLNLTGKADKIVNKESNSNLFAIQPDDFVSLIPKLIIREGDEVSQGSPIFMTKKIPQLILFLLFLDLLIKLLEGLKERLNL